MPNPSISIIMPCYNQGYQLKRVLEAYDNQSTQESFEIIAVDDASPDNTYQILSSYRPNRYLIHAIHQEKNRGPAAARNLGIKIAESPLVIFVGDDILPEKTFLQDHLDAHTRHPETETAILGRIKWPQDMPVNSLMKHIDGMGAEQFSFFYFKDGQVYDFRHFYTANISIKRDLLGRLEHWFDTDFKYAAFEDVELSYRLTKKGMRILYDARPLANHYHYHTIWSFAERQYRAGLMAVVLGRKHPNLRPIVMGKNWLPHLAWLGGSSIFSPVVSQKADDLERAVLRLSSFFEWSPNELTDWLYIRVLHHFYYKGIVQGFYEGSPFKERAVNFYIIRSLSRILKWLFAESAGRNIPFPENLIASPAYH
jgi:glycosyltransferase involved in cell wall biosynthesis